MSNFKKKFRQIKKLPDWFFWIIAAFVRGLFFLLYRFELHDPFHIAENPCGLVGVTWHNRLLFLPLTVPAKLRRTCVGVISASRDGQYVADFLKQFEIGALRGSSSRSGASALRGAIQTIESGKNVIVTPDGPRGPKYSMKNGPVQIASKTGTKVVPFAVNTTRCWQLKSWDNFQIPKPFSKITLMIGEPIEIPPDLDAEMTEVLRKKVEAALLAITVDPQR